MLQPQESSCCLHVYSLYCSYMSIVEALPVYGVHFYDVKVMSFCLQLSMAAFCAHLNSGYI